MPTKVLFISHYAGRTGAPLMLLNVLKWWQKNTDTPFEILLRETGPLKEEFEALAPTYLYQGPGTIPHVPDSLPKAPKFVEYLTRRHHKQLLNKLQASGIGLIYSNTITNGDILETLAPLKCPAVTHVHELDYWIEMSGVKNLEQVKKHSQHYIAASGAVKESLANKYAIPSEHIDVVHSFIPTEGIPAKSEGVRKKLGISEDAFLVLGSGHETWRKGKDIFVQLAALTKKNHPDIETYFLWVGGWQNQEDHRNIHHDVQHLDLTERVHFTGEVSNPLDYFSAGDVFAMVSREDPFPLVSLEAAFLEKPVLCFAGAGGMPEFVCDDAGFIVPYLDIPAMAEAVKMLALDQKMRTNLGEQAAKKVRDHYNVTTGSTKIYKIITNELAKRGAKHESL